jgi:Ca-activated chloride channel family protein
MKIAAAVLACVLVSATLHAELQWMPFDEAVARATAVGKPIVAQLRGCETCNRSLDELLADAEKHDTIVRLLGSFVLARILSGDTSAAAITVRQQVRPTELLILAPDGEYVTLLNRNKRTAADLAMLLVDALSATDSLRETAILRRRGDDVSADLTLSISALAMHDLQRSRELADSAQKAAKKLGNDAAAQYAEISALLPDYFIQHDPYARMVIRERLESFAKHAANPANAAHAYLARATIALNENDAARADELYQKAYDAAPAGSPLRQTAQTALISRGIFRRDSSSRPATLRIIAPQRATFSGRTHFLVETAAPVRRVAWFVDQVAVASANRAPFAVTLNLGNVPRLHTIRAVAYDREGAAVAEATTSVNDRIDAFRVSIVAPAGDRASGRVAFEADVAAPRGRAVKSVELFRGETRVASLTAPPFRTEVELPGDFVYLRAVATLDDGQTAEETRVMNAETVSGELVDVHGFSLPAIINDRDGKRIDGLTSGDLVVRDNGRPLQFSLRDPKDEQATIGVAVDASSSMRPLLLSMVEEVESFINITASKQENIFLMTFDDRPHVIHPATGDAASLRDALRTVRPSGTTAVYDAIAFGLQQFTGLTGKKALLVFTDGVDVVSSESVGACVRLAEESGVQVYFVIPRGMKWPRPPNSGLEQIASVTGGEFINRPASEETASIFTRIRDDIRGQYLITFVSPAKNSGAWRTLRVEAPGRAASIRTVTGYYAR